ncbi:hypothetical protein KPL70_021574 [Citrus sinensis]|nr:hypothetical protein KPL70_021574 [Citrus sinensis]
MVNLLASLEKIKEAEILALIVFAIRSNSRRDEELKIGKTKMKSVMVYFLVRAGISYNHLGNNDCMKLSAQPIIPKAASSPAVMYFEPSEHTNRLHSSSHMNSNSISDKLKHASYDTEDVLDEWNTARLKLQIEGVDADNALSFLQKIKEMNETLDDIASQKDTFNLSVTRSKEDKSERTQSTALINVSEVCGRNEEKNALKGKLLSETAEQPNAIQLISLVGMGGIGKTTLAQLAYNDADVINNFNVRIWVCVSDPFDEFRIAKAIIENLEGSTPNLGELNSLHQRINNSILSSLKNCLNQNVVAI